jgi:hypothetical protein
VYGQEPTRCRAEEHNHEEAHRASALTWFNPSIAHYV